MNAVRIIGVLLVVLGILGAAYGGFSYTHKTDEARLGPFALSVKHTHHINVPLWVGVGAVVVGGALLLVAEGPCQGARENG